VTWRVLRGDCLEVLRELPDVSIDAIVTDPPYGLGFMGRAWDALPPSREWGEACLRVLKPGGRLIVADVWNTDEYAKVLRSRRMKDVRRSGPGFDVFPPVRVVTAVKWGSGA